ncbi:MAG: polysaccharide pyruvyl transferase family protein [Bacteroidales bacterium]|nr:polysaccharide pyruvyl transferase family protein [Bacteroidales bacterium]
MKILLVNFDKCYNHGGVLQGWALQQFLQSLGHQVERAQVPLPGKSPHITLHLCLTICKRLVKKYILGDRTINVRVEFWENDIQYIPHQSIIKFIQSHLKTVTVRSMSELSGSSYDAVIVGSDQVWRRRYTCGEKLLTNKTACDNAFLAFAADWNCRRIAYAASIGVDYWEYTEEETKVFKQLVQNFDAISVREDSAVNLLHQYLNSELKVEHVLDPTLLIDRQMYIDLMREKNVKSHQGELLLYLLDPSEEKDKVVDCVRKQKRLKTFCVNNPKYYNKQLPPQERIQPGIHEWLSGFKDAGMVITDSFHACVFSIIFEKPFFVILNDVRGATRIISLLKIFNLTNRIVHSVEEISSIKETINWEDVRKIQSLWREKSILYLKEALNAG